MEASIALWSDFLSRKSFPSSSHNIFVVMLIFIMALSALISRRIERKTENDLSQQTMLLTNAVSSFHTSLADSSRN
jgi:hypothetical protein